MPVFRYQCESCGLNFSARVANATTAAKCSCGVEAQQDLPRGVSVTTSVSTKSVSTPDSGLSAHDYNIDRIVGSDAKDKWDQIAARQKEKVRIIQATGASGFDLVRQPNGSYGVMKPQQRQASEKTRSFHTKIHEHLREKFPKETKARLERVLPGRASAR